MKLDIWQFSGLLIVNVKLNLKNRFLSEMISRFCDGRFTQLTQMCKLIIRVNTHYYVL